MNPTPPLDARAASGHTAAGAPSEPEGAASLGMAHCCPHCGRPVAVLNVLVPVDEPAVLEQVSAEPRG